MTVSFGPAVANTDGVTLVTNLTGTGANQTENTSTGIRLSKNGGAFAARHATAGASNYDAFGNYLVPLDTTDTNTLGTLRMQYANAAAFCPIFMDFMVVNTALWDALFAASGGAIPNAVAGASAGLLISGSNAGTTTLAALTVTGATTYTGNVVLSDGLTISAPSTLNRAGLSIAGNGTGAGLSATGGATGVGFSIVGGATSGDGLKITTTSGHGINSAPVGTSMHGFLATGGNGGTSDGIKAAAGTGGVDFRANMTGNITGTLATLTTYTGNTVQTGDSFARIGAAGAGLTALGDTRIANLDAAVTTRMATYTQPTGFLSATFPSGTIANTTNLTAGTIATVTNRVTANADQLAGQTVTAAAGVTFPSSVASPTNITAGTITTVTGAVGSVAGNVAGSVGSVAAGGIATASFAAGAINATVIATDAIGSDQLAATAVTEIQAGLATSTALATVQADTDDIQLRLPAALVGGRIDASVGAVAAAAISAASFAANALDAVWSTAARILTAGTNIVLAKGTGLTGLNDISEANVRTALGVATANLDTQLATIDADVLTRSTYAGGAVASVTGNVDGSVGSVVGLTPGNLDVAVSTRLASASYAAPDNTAIAAIRAQTDALTFTVSGQVDTNIRSVNSITVSGTGSASAPWGP
ncbi:MAG TPA: hypothetical protein VN663_22895 [Ramlibacter sp.]|nr:hypothetical protein [Ramlibacter sp.]